MSKFDVKDRVDRFLYLAFNLVSDAVYFFNFKIKKLIGKNVIYKNKHAGQRCFVIGTGPSINDLSDDTVHALKNEIVFAVNSFYKSDKLKSIHPAYYSLFDNYYWDENSQYKLAFKEIVDQYNGKATFLTSYKAKHMVDKLDLSAQQIFLYSKKYPLNSMNCDMTKNMSITMNVVSITILAAMYMGFKEIYLLGCDYNVFATSTTTHCYDDSDEEGLEMENRLGFMLKFYHLTTEFHYLIAKLARLNSIKVINITEGSLLDAYPRKKVNDVLQ
nr:6-hydroxymethylpterin diphosphokinase MptE-like protein [uncultured Mucilaginibacter sp.]